MQAAIATSFKGNKITARLIRELITKIIGHNK
jgi:hypothetical protein